MYLIVLLTACEKPTSDRPISRAELEGTTAGKGKPRGPQKGDLEAYTKDLPGDGPLTATIETELGTIHCELFADKAPLTVANFVGLATGKAAWLDPKTKKVVSGKPFFDGLTFHRNKPDFMIQGGDPLGTGSGGPGYEFADEFHPDLRHDQPGTMSMANSGEDTNGSQFFITEDPTTHLDDKHSVFGRCTEIDVVEAIARSGKKPVMKRVTITKGLPK
jgi:cyclophilin family peptidyl-prolyl cis-trans isomerase